MEGSFEYAFENAGPGFLVFWIVYLIFVCGLAIATYVLRSLGVYTIAKRRSIKNPWFAWIPVVDHYLLGCISDQYQYVAKNRVRNKRKVLLGLSIAMAVLGIVFFGAYIALIVRVVTGLINGASEYVMMEKMMGSLVAVSALSIPMMILSIVTAVFRYIAMYDLYTSCDPRNSAVYLALGIIFHVTEPFFIFFNRKREEGMPPRKTEAAAQPVAVEAAAEQQVPVEPDDFEIPVPPAAPVVQEPWEAEPEKAPWDNADSQ